MTNTNKDHHTIMNVYISFTVCKREISPKGTILTRIIRLYFILNLQFFVDVTYHDHVVVG